jgi:hypothetical protein
MGEKKTGPEMLAETLREIAVLVAVLYTLDIYLGTGRVDLPVPIWIGVGCILSLTIGIILESVRKRDVPD